MVLGLNINVSLTQITGEKLLELAGGPVNLQVTTNISITKVTYVDVLDFNFIFVVNYNPAIASLTIKGSVKVSGEKSELEAIKKSFDEKKVLPPQILQTISNISFVEGVMLSRSLNVPPPLPLPTITPQEMGERRAGPSPSYIA